LLLAFEAGAGLTNTGAATMNIDGIGAKSVKLVDGSNSPAGAITAGGIYLIAYEAGADALILLTPTIAASSYAVLDEDNMASDSASALATQQSIKAYADAMLPLAGGTLSGSLDMGNNAIVDANSIETRSDIKHEGDGDTFIRFTPDAISFHAGGVEFLSVVEASDDYADWLDNEVRRPKLRDYGETVSAHGNSGSGTEDFDLEDGNVHTVTITGGTVSVTFSNPPASGTAGSLTIVVTNGGSQTVNWPAAVDWAGGSAPTLTSSGVDVLTFFTTDGGTTWLGFAAGLDMS